jgi:hypothetical protein
MQNGCLNGRVRRVPYERTLIKGDCQSDEIDIFIRLKKEGNTMFTASTSWGPWGYMDGACTVCMQAQQSINEKQGPPHLASHWETSSKLGILQDGPAGRSRSGWGNSVDWSNVSLSCP